jgi:hypothetical protein
MQDRAANIAPELHNSWEVKSIHATEHMNVAWSEGNDVSGACGISKVPTCVINGLGWKYTMIISTFAARLMMAAYPAYNTLSRHRLLNSQRYAKIKIKT